MADRPGLFISVEGVDGAGKSTQVEALAGALARAGRALTLVREPGGTEVGEQVRDVALHRAFATPLQPWAEALLMVAARAQLVAEVIRPALERGDVVLADRFVDSTLAYQGGGRGLPVAALRSLHRDACGDLWPDLTLLLTLPAGAASERRRSSSLPLDRMEADGESGMMARVAAAYADIATAEPERVRLVDAVRPAAEVGAAVWALVEPRLAPAAKAAR